MSFDGATQYGTTSILPTASGSLECYFKSDDTSGNKLLIGSESASNCFLSVSNGKLSGGIGGEWWVHILGTTTLQTGQWYHAKITWDGAIVKLYLDDIEDYSGAQVGSAVVGQAIYIACKNTNGTPNAFFDGSIIDAKITGDTNQHWDLRDNGLSALTSGTDLTLVGSPVSVTDNTIPVDPANERGFTDDNGTIYLARADDPTTDVLGNPTQWQGSAYPVRPVERQSNALSFDGSTQQVNTLGRVTGTGQITNLSFGVTLTAVNEAGLRHILGEDNPLDPNQRAWGLRYQAGKLSFFASPDGTTANFTRFETEVLDLTSPKTLMVHYSLGVVSMTLEGENLTLTDTSLGSPASHIFDHSNPLVIGNSASSPTPHKGLLSNPTINGTRYPLAEGAGSTAYSTGATSHGTLIGNPTWVREDGIPSSNLDDGFSKRMAFDPASNDGVKFAPMLLTSSSVISLKATFIFGSDKFSLDPGMWGNTANNTTGFFLEAVGTVIVVTDDNNQLKNINLNVTLIPNVKYVIEITNEGGNWAIYVDGIKVNINSIAIADTTINRIGKARFKNANGLIYDASINLDGTLSSYLGTGNQDSDWLDQIGSNNGTVTGGEVLRIPAAEGSNSLDAVGGTLTNPAVSNGPHNDAETELDFYNIATDGGTTPAIAAIGNNRMYFDGVDNVGVSFTPITLTGDFRMSFEASSNTIHQGVLIGDSLNVTWIRVQENGNIIFKGSGGTKSTPKGTFLFDGVSRLFEFEKVGSDIFLKIDNILVYTYLLFTGSEEFSRIGNKANVDEFQGTIHNVNINDQASYLGTGNTNADWLDQIGSNNGTVTGGETLFVPLALTDYTFGDSVSNPMFKRTISSVLEDRHTLFAAVLTGDCLADATAYTT
jgi:hypothetical protein